MEAFDPLLYIELSVEQREAWKYERIERIRALLQLMPTAQMAYILFWAGREPLKATLASVCNWRANHRARHYLASLAMQTTSPGRRSKEVTLNAILDAGTLVQHLMDATSTELAVTSGAAKIVSDINHHRRWNQRLIDVEQMRERCVSLFDCIPTEDSGFNCSSSDIAVFIDSVSRDMEMRLNAARIRGSRSPEVWKTQLIPELYLRDEVGVSMLSAFGLRRGERDDQLRFADTTNGWCLSEERPLLIDGAAVYLPDVNALWHAVYTRFLRASARYPELRKHYTESRVVETLGQLFGSENVLANVWEKRGGPEHDCLVLYGDALLAVEVKASASAPPASPNNAETERRALKHVAEHASVFHAIRQGQGFLRFFQRNGNSPILKIGAVEAEAVPQKLDLSSIRRRYVVAVSLEEYGRITTDWNALDAVDRELGKPWAIDLHSLEQFVWGIQRRGWDGSDFLIYLDDRAETHGGLDTFDELDYAGYWLQHGNLLPFASESITYLGANYASIFDELWLERHGQGSVKFADVNRPSERGEIDSDAVRRQFIADMIDRWEP